MPILRSGIRLLRGALRRHLRIDPGTDPSQWQAQGYRVLSVDIFDTLLHRSSGPLGPRRSTADQASRLLARRGVLVSPDAVLARWSRVERRLQRELGDRGSDPEVSHKDVLRGVLAGVAGGPGVEAELAALARFELDREAATTSVAGAVVELIGRARGRGMRVIAVSDSWYSSAELGDLLARHGVEGIERIYSSSDQAASKFSGGLYGWVYAQEGIRPAELLHVGDNALADDYSARAAGSAALRVERPSSPVISPPAPSTDPAFQLGATALGPAMAYFAHLVLLRADRDVVDGLAFVARDGDLLLEVARILQPAVPVLHRPALRYVYLSRRSTALPGRGALDAGAVAEALAVPAGGASVHGLFASVGLDPADFQPALQRAGLDANTTGIGPYDEDARVRRLVDDPQFRQSASTAAAKQREALEAYLRQEGFFDGRRIALVDVGWRGSTQDALLSAFGGESGLASLRGYYLGLWADPVVEGPKGLEAKEGLISDFRRGRTTREGAAWYLSLLLESVCRASHGPVTGYARGAEGQVQPVLLEDGAGREKERAGGEVQRRIREGVHWAVERYAERDAGYPLDESRARKRVQRLLHRLAFFPTAAELEVAGALSHTETAVGSWSAPLLGDRVNPLKDPRRWLAGLRSPWRAGYVAATGGWPLSIAYVGLENVLLQLPPSLVRGLRARALSLAGNK